MTSKELMKILKIIYVNNPYFLVNECDYFINNFDVFNHDKQLYDSILTIKNDNEYKGVVALSKAILTFLGDYYNIGTVKEIMRHGGENKGYDWFVVKHFEAHDVYLKISGTYDSYSGVSLEEWDDCITSVIPKIKTVTVYTEI